MIGTRKTRDRIRGYYRKIRESKRATPKYLINRKKIFYIFDDIARGLRSSPLVNEDVEEHLVKSQLRIKESKNQVG